MRNSGLLCPAAHSSTAIAPEIRQSRNVNGSRSHSRESRRASRYIACASSSGNTNHEPRFHTKCSPSVSGAMSSVYAESGSPSVKPPKRRSSAAPIP